MSAEYPLQPRLATSSTSNSSLAFQPSPVVLDEEDAENLEMEMRDKLVRRAQARQAIAKAK